MKSMQSTYCRLCGKLTPRKKKGWFRCKCGHWMQTIPHLKHDGPVRRAAKLLVDQVDLCTFEGRGKRCDCVKVAEQLFRTLLKEKV